MGPSHPQDCTSVDIGDCLPNRTAPGLDHWDASNQFGFVRASPHRNQLPPAEVHGVRLEQPPGAGLPWREDGSAAFNVLMGWVVQVQLSIASLALAALAAWGQAASAATVLSIGDGDTISVLERGQKLKVRLACIDAPETAQSPYGLASRNQLRALLPLGSTVSLRVQAVDRYGRTVAEVLGRGIVNLAMVQSGQAFVYRQYLGRCDRGAYLAAERQAQAQRLGVWVVPGGMTRPWDFRHGGAGQRSTRTVPPAFSSSAPVSSPLAAQPSGGKTTCKQIGSFARAQELLRQGYSYLDRNGDGVACESLR